MNDLYWEKPKQPEYPVFKKAREQRPSWDEVKKVYDVDPKYERFYNGIVGNKIEDKEKESNIRSEARKKKAGGKDFETQEDEYFNQLRIKLKGSGSGSEESTPKMKDGEKNPGFEDAEKKRGNSIQNSPQGSPRNNKTSAGKRTASLSNSPRNSGAVTGGTTFSKFKNA